MMLRLSVVSIVLVLLTGGVPAKDRVALSSDIDDQALWTKYNGEAHRLCPSHHIEDFSDGMYDEVLGDFLKAYSSTFRARVSAIVNYPQTCAKETMGFTCEFSAHLAAFWRVGLFRKFVSYSCRHWQCQEIALCHKIGR
jgi:hypothetical protein